MRLNPDEIEALERLLWMRDERPSFGTLLRATLQRLPKLKVSGLFVFIIAVIALFFSTPETRHIASFLAGILFGAIVFIIVFIAVRVQWISRSHELNNQIVRWERVEELLNENRDE